MVGCARGVLRRRVEASVTVKWLALYFTHVYSTNILYLWNSVMAAVICTTQNT